MSQIGMKGSCQQISNNWPISSFPEQTLLGPGCTAYPEIMIVIISKELGAIRLVDFLGLEQGEAAKLLKQSEESLNENLKSDRKKIACAILYNKILKIEGTHLIFHQVTEID